MDSGEVKKWENSCLKKCRYPSLESAESYIKIIKEKDGVTLYSYRCSSCESWHLTKTPDHKYRYKKLRVC